MSAALLQRLAEAGTPLHLVMEVAEALADAKAAERLLERRREKDRLRKRSTDSAEIQGSGGNPETKETPHTPKKNTPPNVSPKGDTTPPRKRASRLPDGFMVPDDWLQWAMRKRSWTLAQAQEEAACFCRYWQAKSGTAATKLDWEKTWRNWVVNSHRAGVPNDTAKPRGPLTADELERMIQFHTTKGEHDKAADCRRRLESLRQTGPPSQSETGELAGAGNGQA